MLHPTLTWPSFNLLSITPGYHEALLQTTILSHNVAKVLESLLDYCCFKRALRADLLHHRLVSFFLGPRNLQHSPPAPQLKCIYVMPVLLSNCPRFTSIHSNGKDQGSDHLDFGLFGESTVFMSYLSFTIATLARLSLLLISSEHVLSLFTKLLREVERSDHLYFISIHLEFTSVICHHHFGLLDVQIKTCICTLLLALCNKHLQVFTAFCHEGGIICIL